MKLRTKYILFVAILHLVTLILSYYIFKNNIVLFIASEVLILLSALLSAQLYKQLLQPLRTLMNGIEAIRDKDFTTKFSTTGKYEMDQLITVYNQMIDQLRTERTRQEQQHFFLEKLIQTSPTGIVILDFDNKVQQLNLVAVKLLGLDEKQVINKEPVDIDHPLLNQLAELKSGDAKTISLNGINTYKISKSHFIDRGFPRVFIMIEELTLELLEAEKKAYGKVIRMMAHEVNNTIGPVNSIIETTLKNSALATDNNQNLRNALQVAVDRNKNLTTFMKNFADIVRLPLPVKKQVDVHEMLNNITTLMSLKAGEKEITFNYELATGPMMISADENQLEQVLINVVKNAIEAIQERGTITFTTKRNPSELIITDTGRGIDPDIKSRLFTPFFSTKKDGQGVGLMLIREILLNHQYRFSLTSGDVGTTSFTINFNSTV